MENKITDAHEARILAEQASEKNINNVLEFITNQAKMGHTECVLFGNPISFEGVKKLMSLGFSVSEFVHPLEQRKMQKVAW